MAKITASMDQAILNLINLVESKGMLKLSPRRFKRSRPKKPIYCASDLLRAEAAARVLSVSPKTLANWRVSGSGPRYVKSGRLITYRYSELQAFVANKTRSSTSDTGANP